MSDRVKWKLDKGNQFLNQFQRNEKTTREQIPGSNNTKFNTFIDADKEKFVYRNFSVRTNFQNANNWRYFGRQGCAQTVLPSGDRRSVVELRLSLSYDERHRLGASNRQCWHLADCYM